MKNFYIAVLVSAFLFGGMHRASAQSCVDLSKAQALAAWAVASGATYSQSNRACGGESQFPGAPSGSPTSTGYCSTYDCSSFTTWILRQIPGQQVVAAAPGDIPSTYVMWGSGSAGPQNGSPSGMKPCDPTKQPVCIGMTEFGEGGQSGPGHVVTALCGKVYSASPPIMDNYVTPMSGTTQSRNGSTIVWITPFGLENATMSSCSSSCTSTSTTAGGFGGANPAGTAGAAASTANMSELMMMSMMMSSMGPMMSAMSSLGSGASSGLGSTLSGTGTSGTGSSAASTGSTASSGTSSNGTTATGAASISTGATSAASTSAGGFSTLVNRLSSMMAGTSSGAAATTATGTTAAAAAATTGITSSTALQDVQNLDAEAAQDVPSPAISGSSLQAQPAAADPTADYHANSTGSDHRLTCPLTGSATVAGCR